RARRHARDRDRAHAQCAGRDGDRGHQDQHRPAPGDPEPPGPPRRRPRHPLPGAAPGAEVARRVMSGYLALTVELDGRDPAAAEEAAFGAGAVSVTLTDAVDDAILEPAPGEVRLWPRTVLQALFPAG